MIVVVEGISASGKSSWCASHADGHVVPENGRSDGAPDRTREPGAAAAYWVERNVERWQAALSVERTTGLAVCDTDPLKLHYIWSLWQIGEAKITDWQMESAATRETIARGRIGFADRYLVGTLEPDIARERRHADRTRRRRNFELHVRLQPALIAWYTALAAVLPERVRFGFPAQLPDPSGAPAAAAGRYDVAAFDRMIASLPGSACT